MEKCFSSITSKASNELKQAKQLIHALPLLDKLEGALERDWIPERCKNLVLKLQSFELNEKMKDAAADVLVELLELLLMEESKFDSNLHPTSINNVYMKFEEYLDHVKTIGEDFLKTTVTKSEIKSIKTFKLVDRYERLQAERDKLAFGLAEREAEVKCELSQKRQKLKVVSREIEDEKEKLQIRESELDIELQTTLESITLNHRNVMVSLQDELEQLQDSLRLNSIQYSNDIDNKRRDIQKCQRDLENMRHSHEETRDNLEKQMHIVSSTIPDIERELEELTHRLLLLLKNDEIESEEKKLLQKIIDLEQESASILYRAASQIQRIYRGIQGRNHAYALKKKSKKKKKKTKS